MTVNTGMELIMDQQAFDEVVVDVAKHFATPEALLANQELTRDQKLALLRQWEYDLHLLHIATEENMTGDTPQGNNAVTIQQIHAAASKLGANLDAAGAAKTGAVINEKS